MDKQELIENVKELTIFSKQILNVKLVDQYDVIKLIEQLDEPQKVTIPYFVANWIEEKKDERWKLSQMLLQANLEKNYGRWIVDNQEKFARAWINGYTVEKEKRYTVKIKGLNPSYTVLKYHPYDKTWFFGREQKYDFFRLHHTRKELDEAGFGDVFNSPLFEVEEVEE